MVIAKPATDPVKGGLKDTARAFKATEAVKKERAAKTTAAPPKTPARAMRMPTLVVNQLSSPAAKPVRAILKVDHRLKAATTKEGAKERAAAKAVVKEVKAAKRADAEAVRDHISMQEWHEANTAQQIQSLKKQQKQWDSRGKSNLQLDDYRFDSEGVFGYASGSNKHVVLRKKPGAVYEGIVPLPKVVQEREAAQSKARGKCSCVSHHDHTSCNYKLKYVPKVRFF